MVVSLYHGGDTVLWWCAYTMVASLCYDSSSLWRSRVLRQGRHTMQRTELTLTLVLTNPNLASALTQSVIHDPIPNYGLQAK